MRVNFQMNKGPQYPGPTLAGWGRTPQKRRLEYETVENKYGKRECNKNWDIAGTEIRTTDYLQIRVYAGWPGRILEWLKNWGTFTSLTILPGVGPLALLFYVVCKWDTAMQRWAWW